MKKAFLWLMAFAVLVGVVLVGWELVAKPGPMRRAWWAYKAYKNPVYEANCRFPWNLPITEDQLAEENRVLDRMDLLVPLVKELGLTEYLGVPDDTAAAVRLAEASNLRRGENELQVVLYVHSPDREFLKKVINPLAKAYIEKRQVLLSTGQAKSVR
jgi:hypothetical protein